jgi:hypothetical protein
LAAALCYLRSCLNGAIVDTLRSYSRAKEVSLPEPGLLDEPAIEYSEEEGQGLWETIQGMITNEHERRLAYLLFHCNLKPRDIVRLCPQEFSEVREVYRLRRKTNSLENDRLPNYLRMSIVNRFHTPKRLLYDT